MITHHCPHPDLMGLFRDNVAAAYESNLIPLIEQHQPHAWLFGHTHHPVEAKVDRTLIRNVSLGYPRQVRPGSEAATVMTGFSDQWQTNSTIPDERETRRSES